MSSVGLGSVDVHELLSQYNVCVSERRSSQGLVSTSQASGYQFHKRRRDSNTARPILMIARHVENMIQALAPGTLLAVANIAV